MAYKDDRLVQDPIVRRTPVTTGEWCCKMGVTEVNAEPAPLLGGGVLLLCATLWAVTISARVTRKWRREVRSRVRGAIIREREHIAGELHDVIAHHLTVMIAGARAAKRVSTFDETIRALCAVETVGRDALAEMRRLLGRLRIEPEETGPPGLDQLPTLVARVENAGLPVRLTVRGDRRPLPDGIDANAYRIIQEALTNALKHAGPTRADVVVGYHPGALRLWISDFGVGEVAGCEGFGLTGMRQRVARLGGEIATGSGPDGGFQVTVALPVNSRRG